MRLECVDSNVLDNRIVWTLSEQKIARQHYSLICVHSMEMGDFS